VTVAARAGGAGALAEGRRDRLALITEEHALIG
jgi:hypothetical protein